MGVAAQLSECILLSEPCVCIFPSLAMSGQDDSSYDQSGGADQSGGDQSGYGGSDQQDQLSGGGGQDQSGYGGGQDQQDDSSLGAGGGGQDPSQDQSGGFGGGGQDPSQDQSGGFGGGQDQSSFGGGGDGSGQDQSGQDPSSFGAGGGQDQSAAGGGDGSGYGDSGNTGTDQSGSPTVSFLLGLNLYNSWLLRSLLGLYLYNSWLLRSALLILVSRCLLQAWKLQQNVFVCRFCRCCSDRSIDRVLQFETPICFLHFEIRPTNFYFFFPGSNDLVLIMTCVTAPPRCNPKNKTKKKSSLFLLQAQQAPTKSSWF